MFSTKEEFAQHQEKCITELQNLSKRLEELPKKLNDYGLQKLNSVCFVPAKIYHTNEILVHLGNDFFVERTSFQARDIAQRRIKVYQKNLSEVKGQNKKQEKNKVIEIKEPIQPEKELQVKPKIEQKPKVDHPLSSKDAQIQKKETPVKVEDNNDKNQENKADYKPYEVMSSLQQALILLNNGGKVEDFYESDEDSKNGSDNEDDVEVEIKENQQQNLKQIKEEPEEAIQIKSVSTPSQKSNLKKSTSGSQEQRKSVQFGQQIIFEPPKELQPEEQLKEKDQQLKERIAKLDERAQLLGKTEEDEPKNVAMENIMEKIKPKKESKTKTDKKQKVEKDQDEEVEEEPKKISRFKQRMMEKNQ